MGKDYAKGRIGRGTVSFKDGTVLHVLDETSTWVRAIIREACAEAIRDTKRSERRRAARIVEKHVCGKWGNISTEAMVRAILGKKGAKR